MITIFLRSSKCLGQGAFISQNSGDGEVKISLLECQNLLSVPSSFTKDCLLAVLSRCKVEMQEASTVQTEQKVSVLESFSPKVIITQAKVFKACQVSTFQVHSFTNMKNGFHGQLNSLLFKEDCYRKELKIEEASETLKGKSRY